jgi:hypothetical protein
VIEIDWASASVADGRLTQRTLRVGGLTPGSEAELRHFLESAVLQANVSAGLEAAESGGDDQRSSADREMTQTFRAFADG